MELSKNTDDRVSGIKVFVVTETKGGQSDLESVWRSEDAAMGRAAALMGAGSEARVDWDILRD